MCASSSSAILQNLSVSDKALTLAKEIRDGSINNESVFLQRVRSIYPEFGFYSGTVEGSPDGSPIDGNEQEQRRTELSFLCLYWLMRGDYDKLTSLQKPEEKLSRATFDVLCAKIKTLLHDDEAVDAMLSTMAIHDLGKIVWFQNKVKETSKSTSVDHDEILLFALEHCPEILPSYSRLQKKYQVLIRDAWAMRFNLGQFVQGENLPANLSNCLSAARNNPHVIEYFFLHEMLDLGGVTGHKSLAGSETLNENNCFAYDAAWSIVINPAYQNETAAYDAYLAARASRLELKITNNEMRAVVRLCCNARLYSPQDAQLVLDTFNRLPAACKTILTEELNVSGMDNKKGILLYYAPQTLVNLITNKSGEAKALGLTRGFEVLARLYMEARIHLKEQNSPGIYPLFIAPVSTAAAKDPDMLKHKDFEIDLKAGKVTNVIDRQPIKTETFKATKSLGELPGNRVVVIGIGGGSDGIQAKLVSELMEKSGKQVVGTVSVRTKFTTFDSSKIPKGTERKIINPVANLGNDTYLLAPNSKGEHFDRFLENAVADSKTTFMVLDAMRPELSDEENIAGLERQFQHLIANLQADTVIGLDTGGDGLYQESTVDGLSDSKSTPDQDLRVIKALSKLNGPNLITMEVATGVDSPGNAEQVLHQADAVWFAPSDSEKQYLLQRYHQLGMDAETALPDRFGKTPFAWQQAMTNSGETGFYFLPIPKEKILDAKSPWNPVVFLEPAMQGIFVMDLHKHVKAICRQEVKEMEVDIAPQAKL